MKSGKYHKRQKEQRRIEILSNISEITHNVSLKLLEISKQTNPKSADPEEIIAFAKEQKALIENQNAIIKAVNAITKTDKYFVDDYERWTQLRKEEEAKQMENGSLNETFGMNKHIFEFFCYHWDAIRDEIDKKVKNDILKAEEAKRVREAKMQEDVDRYKYSVAEDVEEEFYEEFIPDSEPPFKILTPGTLTDIDAEEKIETLRESSTIVENLNENTNQDDENSQNSINDS